MEKLSFKLDAPTCAGGSRKRALVGVVASGNLEVLLERASPPEVCTIDIATAAHGFGAVWEAVVCDFVTRRAAGGLRISVNDGGARPDTVALRLAQGVRMIEEPEA
jgi:malonate decarboxylase delta subunit